MIFDLHIYVEKYIKKRQKRKCGALPLFAYNYKAGQSEKIMAGLPAQPLHMRLKFLLSESF